jgi:AraC-like DNA-binding protein
VQSSQTVVIMPHGLSVKAAVWISGSKIAGASRVVARPHGVAWLHQFVEHLQVTLIEPVGHDALPRLGSVLQAVPPPPTKVADLCARQLLETVLLRISKNSPLVSSELVTVAASLCEGDWPTLAARLESVRVASSRSSSVAYRTKQYLDDNYRNPCRLIDVARSVGASTRQVTKEFSATYGRSIHQYLIVIRLKSALDMLSSSDEKVTSIATAVGFGNVSVMYRHFGALCGASPGVFRGARPEASAAKARIDLGLSDTNVIRASNDSVIA